MGHIAETKAAKAEIPVYGARSAAKAATIYITGRKFLRFAHFGHP